jgi:hypothetical protein
VWARAFPDEVQTIVRNIDALIPKETDTNPVG